MSEITWSVVIATRNRFGLLQRAISAVCPDLTRQDALLSFAAPFFADRDVG